MPEGNSERQGARAAEAGVPTDPGPEVGVDSGGELLQVPVEQKEDVASQL